MKRNLFQVLFVFSFFTCYSQDTIRLYLDNNFIETQREKANILRLAVIQDNHFLITDQFINGKMINYGEYSSVNPWIYDGQSRHYDEFGKLYSSGKYYKDKFLGIWIYYSDQKNDTVDYQYADYYYRLVKDSCKTNQQSLVLSDSLIEIIKLKENILNFIKSNMHLPARSRELDANYKIKADILLDKEGLIKCPIINDSVDIDLKYEILRVLFLFKNPNKLQKPVRMIVPVVLNAIKISEEQGLWFVELNASFEGGDLNKFSNWIKTHVVYPPEAFKKGISGKVIVQFSIDSNGNVCDIKVMRGADTYLNQEAIRVIANSPKWTPAKTDNKSVKQNFVIPIVFNAK
jgi:TonB family protein